MIGDLLNNNKRRDVKTREDQVLYMGHKYRQDKRTGYYVCTSEKTGRKRLHVAMWEHEAGCAVPPGCVIHHLDWVKSHNTIDNLVCVSMWEHNQIHNWNGIGAGGRDWGYELKEKRGLRSPRS